MVRLFQESDGVTVFLQSTRTKLTMRRPYRFILGLITGVTIGAILILIFSGINVSQSDQLSLASVVLSGMTYSGFALVLFGYLYKRGGAKNFMADFLLGVGIGIILVWFVGAGNGSIPGNGVLY